MLDLKKLSLITISISGMHRVLAGDIKLSNDNIDILLKKWFQAK